MTKAIVVSAAVCTTLGCVLAVLTHPTPATTACTLFAAMVLFAYAARTR